MIRLSVLSAVVLLMAGCADEPEPDAQPEAAPMGEVLEGSISDEMIPYDLLRSQAPLEASSARGGGPAAGETSEVDEMPDVDGSSEAGGPAE